MATQEFILTTTPVQILDGNAQENWQATLAKLRLSKLEDVV